MPLLEDDVTQTCPYDKSHEILVERFSKHLTKCRKNFPNSNMAICHFSWSHHVPVSELKSHEKNCPDRDLFEEIHRRTEATTTWQAPPVTNSRACTNGDEDWETETAPTYVPGKIIAEQPVLYRKDLLSKAQKKLNRMEQSNRIRTLNDTPNATPKVEPVATAAQPAVVPPLRRPANVVAPVTGRTNIGRGQLRQTVTAVAATSTIPPASPSTLRKLTASPTPYDSLMRQRMKHLKF